MTRPTTRTSTRPIATYTGTRAQAGQERKICHQERSGGPGATGLSVDWSVMVLAIVPYHWQSSGPSASTRVPARYPPFRRMTTVPTYQYACTECVARLRAVPELHRRRADRVPRVRRPPAEAVQRRRRRVQGLGLLPHRQPRGGRLLVAGVLVLRGLVSGSDSSSSGGTATKTESKPAPATKSSALLRLSEVADSETVAAQPRSTSEVDDCCATSSTSEVRWLRKARWRLSRNHLWMTAPPRSRSRLPSPDAP